MHFLKNIIFTEAYLIIFTTGAGIPRNAFSLLRLDYCQVYVKSKCCWITFPKTVD